VAAVDYFLKVDGIEGESEDSKHGKEIEVLSWTWSESQQGSMGHGTGGGAGKVAMADFQFTMKVCKASPKLMLACANGEHIKSATLTCRKAGKEQQEFLKFTFSDILVSSYHIGGNAGDIIPSDSISFNFTKIETAYKVQNADGTLGAEFKAGYDLKKAVKV
jgi:type VI secretion system secreted protein Hcp